MCCVTQDSPFPSPVLRVPPVAKVTPRVLGRARLCPPAQGLTGVGHRAQFTGVAPGPPQGAAAGRTADAGPDLRRAGDAAVTPVVRVQEAVPDPGV